MLGDHVQNGLHPIRSIRQLLWKMSKPTKMDLDKDYQHQLDILDMAIFGIPATFRGRFFALYLELCLQRSFGFALAQ
jgi:hypothetical protein